MPNFISTENLHALKGQLSENTLLAPYTSWRIGGMAKYFFQPATIDDLSCFLSMLPKEEPIILLGAGTNVLVRDAGFNGAVILMKNNLTELKFDELHGMIYAQAGWRSAELSRFAADKGLMGFEFLIGIPGTVGGALTMNAGAYDQQTWDHVIELESIDRSGQKHYRKPTEYEVGYRHVKMPPDEWFVGARWKLPPGNRETSLQQMHDMLQKRQEKHPLKLPNAGSVFRNPPNQSAAKLITESNLKGYHIGDACVSEQHANFIVNLGCATSADVESLIAHIQATVEKDSGVRLELEVRVIG